MSVEILRGTLLAQLQNETWDFDPARGWRHGMDYLGISQANMQILQQAYANDGIACRLVYRMGGNASLDVDDSTMSYTIDTWQILGNEESRDGLSHPGLAYALAGFDVGKVIAYMRKALAEDKCSTDAFATGQPLNGTPAAAVRFYDLQTRGSTDYRHGQYVLRHTTNAPNRWGVNVADFGIDQIYTSGQLLTEAQNSAAWIYPLPGRLAYKIGAIPTPYYRANYLWGWLKSASIETTGSNNRVDIATEYCLDQWSTDYNYPY